MKQNLTKHVFTLLIVIILSVAWTSAENLFFPIEPLGSVNYCNTEGNIYLDEDNDTDGIADRYLYLRSNFYMPPASPPKDYNAVQLPGDSDHPQDATKIYYYASDSNVITKRNYGSTVYVPIDNATFYRGSWVFPYGQWVRGADTNNIRINFERPLTTGADNTISIKYLYKYTKATSFRSTNLPNPKYRYNTVASGGDFHGLTPANRVDRGLPLGKERRWGPIETTTACKNYIIHRCGDGVKDLNNSSWMNGVFTSEVCDDGPLNGTPGKCKIDCSGTGAGGTNERCGDEVIQPVGSYYNGSPQTPENMSFEECDDGDLTGDTNGILNGDDPEVNFCTSICLPMFVEEFVEEFVN